MGQVHFEKKKTRIICERVLEREYEKYRMNGIESVGG